VGYQNQALGARYESLLARVQEREAEIGNEKIFSDAVARSYFKLLSYKDEFEVARLHTRKEFIDSVRRDFGRKAKFRFHLAPPVLNSALDSRGRPRKKEFGAWMLPVFRVLASLRGLRGTVFDVFGYTAERRMERELIIEFEQLLEKLLPALDRDVHSATEIVRLYMAIRGYGPVKEESAEKVRRQVAEKLANFSSASSAAA
jgi:indolepyruvate ferredoxin oxidoreductase